MSMLAIDTGGTFTDFVWYSPEGPEVRLAKVPSDPKHLERVCAEGLERLGIDLSSVDRIVHGTTLVTNTVLEGDGARVAMVTTQGYRDIVEIGRQRRHEMYDLRTLAVRPLSPRRWRLELAERTLADGSTVRRPAESDLAKITGQLDELGVEAVAVCLLFSFLDPTNEETVAAELRRRGQWFVTASHEVVSQAREYERFSTTVMNAFVGPRSHEYLDGFADFLARRQVALDRVFLMGATGGAMTWPQARRSPVTMLNSGPAGGVRGAVALARGVGHSNIITFDMGGTSTDVCLIRELEPTVTSEGFVENRPLLVPKLDIATIGAGGGSIAWIDVGGELQVGPRSAGASPGPACYGRNGSEPTVTDADVVLGRIGDGTLLGESVSVRRDLAASAVQRIADAFPDMSLPLAAEGIARIAVAKMHGAIREVSVARGVDPRQFALLTFGGAGGMHAVEVARTLGIPTVLVPPAPGVFSALGLLFCDVRHDYVESRFVAVDALPAVELETVYAAMEKRAHERLAQDGFPDERITFQRSADVRYQGQWFELNLPMPAMPTTPDEVDAAFRVAHLDRFNVDMARPTEYVNFRLAATGRTEKPTFGATTRRPGGTGQASSRQVFFEGHYRETAVYLRDELPVGMQITGPAVIEERGATTVIPPGCSGVVHDTGSLVITVGS